MFNLITFTICIIYNCYTDNFYEDGKKKKKNPNESQDYRLNRPFLKKEIASSDLQRIDSYIQEIKAKPNYNNIEKYIEYLNAAVIIIKKKNKKMKLQRRRYWSVCRDITII